MDVFLPRWFSVRNLTPIATFRCLVKIFVYVTVIVSILGYSNSLLAYSYFLLGQQQGNPVLIEANSTDASNNEPVVWNSVNLNISLGFDGVDAPPLVEGIRWNQVALLAAQQWNEVAENLTLTTAFSNVELDACANQEQNNVTVATWGQSYCGTPWGDDVLALTQLTYQITQTNEGAHAGIISASIVVNNTKNWGVYRGPVQYLPDGTPINDFQRAVLHELGHVAGLTHPDENGQQIQALMNSKEGSLDGPAVDDINGINALYPSLNKSTAIQQSAKGGGAVDYFLIFGLFLCYRLRSHRVSRS